MAKESDKNKESCKRYRKKLKLLVFNKYSSGKIECIDCGEDNIEKLELDHPSGGGNKHRRELFGTNKGGSTFYAYLKKNNFPDHYDIRCKRCNLRKRHIDPRQMTLNLEG